MHYGRREQLLCIGYIEEQLEKTKIGDFKPVVAEHIRECSRVHSVHPKTIRHWWNKYVEWGLAPFEVKEEMRRYRKKRLRYKRTTRVTDEVVNALEGIIEAHPEYYLDEIAIELLASTSTHLSISTIHR